MKRNKFSLSHYRLYSCNLGELIPTAVVEVLPGDTIQHATNLLVRTQPLLAPVMHPVDVRIHHWFVPHRINWVHWEDFITGGPDGLNASVYPTIGTVTGVPANSLADYMGIPPGFNGAVSAMPFRAYARIWNEFYRDEDLDPLIGVGVEDGNDTTTNTVLQVCSWEKDYFTSARPWEQKGPSVTIPLGTTAQIIPDTADRTSVPTFWGPQSSPESLNAGTGNPSPVFGLGPAAATAPLSWNDPALLADLASASSVTVNILREALALQRFEEARARFGSRYVEYLRYLGVRSSDARLQRPEYLGGGRQTIQFSEVLQTAPSVTDNSSVGELKGHGIAGVRSNRYRRFFEEHGYVITLVSVRPKTMYMQGIQKTWNRRSREDFWQKEFEHIGQQKVLNKEVFALGSDPDGTFGYQDRYDEYRRMESSVAGEFRSSLNFWHFAREFATQPGLNSTFVRCIPTERVFPDNAEHTLWVMAKHSIQARRMLTKTGTSFIF